MPKPDPKRLHRRRNVSSPTSQRKATRSISAGSRSRSGNAATDFTVKHQLKLQAGDLRLARIGRCMALLQHEMWQSEKKIAKLCKVVKLDIDLS